MTTDRFTVRRERGQTPPWRPRGWDVIRERGDGQRPTKTWHPTWEDAMETADWLAHFGRGH